MRPYYGNGSIRPFYFLIKGPSGFPPLPPPPAVPPLTETPPSHFLETTWTALPVNAAHMVIEPIYAGVYRDGEEVMPSSSEIIGYQALSASGEVLGTGETQAEALAIAWGRVWSVEF